MANSANQPISAKKGGMAVPIRSALKRTPMRDFNSFSIKVYYILISTTYQKNGDLFYSLLFLDFRTVCLSFVCDKRCGTESTMECFMYTFSSLFFSNISENNGKDGFYQKLLIYLPFPQTGKPYYFTELVFWNFKIPKGSNHVI